MKPQHTWLELYDMSNGEVKKGEIDEMVSSGDEMESKFSSTVAKQAHLG